MHSMHLFNQCRWSNLCFSCKIWTKMCKNKNHNGNGSWDNTHQCWLVSGRQ